MVAFCSRLSSNSSLLTDAINQVRAVPPESEFVRLARAIGICLGDEIVGGFAMSADAPKGLVLNIQHFCTNDGPGIRTTVFLKFCSLRCKWCSNPESIGQKPELAYNASKCIGEEGLRALPEVAGAGRARCISSRARTTRRASIGIWRASAARKPPRSARPRRSIMFGKHMSVDEVLDEVEQDSAFYRESGGGITLSGGECLLQPDFSAAVLAEAHRRGINTAIETAGNVPWDFMAKVLPHVDVMLHDHKLTDPVRHKKWTGVDNKRIKENFKRAYETFPDVRFIARTPLIPGRQRR